VIGADLLLKLVGYLRSCVTIGLMRAWHVTQLLQQLTTVVMAITH